jgi:hypothetical protein
VTYLACPLMDSAINGPSSRADQYPNPNLVALESSNLRRRKPGERDSCLASQQAGLHPMTMQR